MHNLLEKIEAEGLEELVADKQERIDNLIDHMNTIKIMNAVGDKRMANYFYEKVIGWMIGHFKDKLFVSRAVKHHKSYSLKIHETTFSDSSLPVKPNNL